MARTVGVKKVFLMKEGCKAWTFIDDYRPELYDFRTDSCGIDRRYAEYDEFGGMVWFTDRKTFNDATEGNSFYQELLKEGYKPSTEEEVRKLKNRASIMTY